jgi:glutathione peroxidase-family protein
MECDPPAAAGSLYENSAKIFPLGPDKSMCSYRGDVVLIVNTAAL